MESKKIYFNNRDGIRLSCSLEVPPRKPRAFALFAHCFTCSKNIKAAYHISHTLANRGIACLRFDFTGIGESEGNFENTTFSSDVNDIIDAAGYLFHQYESPQILIGHSLGGTAVLKAAGTIDSVKAVVTIGSPYDPSQVIKLINEYSDNKVTKNNLVTLGEKKFLIKDQFLKDVNNSDISDDISNLRKALLILHAPLDNIVSVNNASQIFSAAKHPKSFISLHNSDHLLSDQSDSIYAAQIISAWTSRYISESKDENDIIPIDNKVIVQTSNQSLTTDIFSGSHHLIADEPVSLGGSDEGPNPYDYLLASLGACTSMTVMMYAKRKDWDLESVKVTLDHSKIHASDCKECETKTGKVDYIERNVEFIGKIDENQKKRLSEIADKCPVHRTLHSEIVVKTIIIE
jgi:uncharacterized OsmC-like protein/alpha/beta superfamily hydrolase